MCDFQPFVTDITN